MKQFLLDLWDGVMFGCFHVGGFGMIAVGIIGLFSINTVDNPWQSIWYFILSCLFIVGGLIVTWALGMYTRELEESYFLSKKEKENGTSAM